MDATQVEQVGSAWLSKNSKRRYDFFVWFDIDHLAWHLAVSRKSKPNWFYARRMLPTTLDSTMIEDTMSHLVKAVERLFRRLNRMSRAERKQWRMKNANLPS